jgi:class 3 adenylate cyclase
LTARIYTGSGWDSWLGWLLLLIAGALALQRLLQERARSEALLLNVLPAAIAARLKRAPGTIADQYPAVTVLFADIAGFTPFSADLPPATLVAHLNTLFSAFDRLAAQYGVEKIKTIGDAYMGVAGAPVARPDHAVAGAELALAMQAALPALSAELGVPLAVRIGLHTGPVVAGVIGTQKFSYDLWGDTVNTASRMESHGASGEIHCSESAYLALCDNFLFTPRGTIDIKGKGPMPTYFLRGPKEP